VPGSGDPAPYPVAMHDERADPAGRLWPIGLLLILPLLGLAVLIARPELDLEWQHQPSHFWLVLIAAAVNVVLAYLTNTAAGRYHDARLILISLAFLASAGFLGLHALATPGVLLHEPNVGFAVATPVGLIIASVFAALSATPLAGPRAMAVLRLRRVLLGGLLAVMGAWAIGSIAQVPPLDGPPPPREGAGILDVLSIVAVGLYVFAAWRLTQLYRYRGGAVLFSMAVALVLLAEAMIAVLVSRNWHLSWWEWHLLLLAAFAMIALAARREYQRRGSLSAAFGGLYLEATLAQVDRWYATAVAAVAAAEERGDSSTEQVLGELRREGASDDELALLARTAHEVGRLDEAFRPYMPAVLTERLRRRAGSAPPAGEERVVTIMFADLAGFTTFSETHPPRVVVEMLNTYWGAVVPIIEASGGTIEHFAGDGVMTLYNVDGDQPDHARRAARAATAIVSAARELAASHAGWPVFRLGINTGTAIVGVLGADARRSFAAIGDPVNTAARLMTIGAPGEIITGRATWEMLAAPAAGTSLGAVRVKGKREAVEAWRLDAAAVARLGDRT
jgi:adenylate cyclase